MALVKIPKGITPDGQGMWGLFALMNNVNNASWLPPTNTTITGTTGSLTSAQILNGVSLFSGGSGDYTLTTDTAAQIINAFGGPQGLIPLDGTFAKPIRIINISTNNLLITGGTGVTITAGAGNTGAALFTFSDAIVQVTSATTVTIYFIGTGTAQ